MESQFGGNTTSEGGGYETKVRVRRGLDDDFRAQLAIERFSGKQVGIRELARRYGRAEAVVSRAILSAFREGLVEVRRVSRQQLKRIGTLERALLNRFHSLQHAIVVQVGGKLDVVQEHLGKAIASYLSEARVRNGERILLGPGRCVFHMAEWLCNAPTKLRPSDVTLTSICGDSYPFHDDTRNVCLDADANVNLFSQAFQHPTLMRLTSRQVFAERDSWRDEYYGRFAAEPPSIAIVGVGVVNAHHQLALLTDPASSQRLPPVALSRELREDIRHLLGFVNSEGQSVVAELGTRLFTVPRFTSDTSRDGESEHLAELVNKVNRHLFAPEPGHYRHVKSIMLVGGREGKAGPMKHLLDTAAGSGEIELKQRLFPAGLPIHVLCTDEDTAKQLLVE